LEDAPKEKKRKGMFNNVLKSRKNNLPFYLTHHFRVQYLKGQNPNPGNVSKEKKRKGTLVTFSNQKKNNKFLSSPFNLLNFSSSPKSKSRRRP
jgi:hypothetical protein